MKNNYWMKLWFDILNDPKMGMLPDRLWRRVIELFLLAGQEGEDGLLPDIEIMAWTLKLSKSALEKDLERIAEVGIVTKTNDGWVVTNFKKRNEPVDPAKRIKDFRQRERYEKGNEDVTELKRECNDAVTNRYQEEQRNRRTDLSTTLPPLPPTEIVQFGNVYNDITGKDPQFTPEEVDAIQAIIQAGGTTDDYRNALLGMRAKDYTIGNMASAMNWTLTDIQKRKNPVKRGDNGHKPAENTPDKFRKYVEKTQGV
jgi:hypothetical protein